MPKRPPRPCGRPGCPNLATSKERRLCAKHLEEWRVKRRAWLDERARERGRRHDRKRPSAARRGYGHRWRKLRAAVLARKPVCACGRMATEVDHIKALSKGGTNEWENLRPMCKSCHSQKTAREDRS